MKVVLSVMALLVLVMSASDAPAESTAPSGSAKSAGLPTAAAGGDRGVDITGRRVDVQAPHGATSQAEADAKEAPVTADQLNELALRDATQPRYSGW